MSNFIKHSERYLQNLKDVFSQENLRKIEELSSSIQEQIINKRKIFLCGNGGSAANSIHIANDLIYGIRKTSDDGSVGANVYSLAENTAVLTCLANDIGYEAIYAYQLKAKAQKDDLLITLTGSGNSKNIINAINIAKELEMKEFSVVGYNGGICKQLSKNCIHFDVQDMQIAEDCQLILGHLIMQHIRGVNQ